MQHSAVHTKENTAHATSDDTTYRASQYAEVAIPLHVAKTFTYSLPLEIRLNARVGSRLLVPFGRQRITGYIVAFNDNLDTSTGLNEADIKEADQLLDEEPLLTTEVLEITRWVAEYYAAPWGEVLKAALPAGLNATIEQILSITLKGRDELSSSPLSRTSISRKHALQIIADAREIPLRRFAQHVGPAQATRFAREFQRTGWIRIEQRSRAPVARAKIQKCVRLIPPEMNGSQSSIRALTKGQQRIMDTLVTQGGEIEFTALIKRANAGASTIATLEKRRLLEVVAHNVRRDPLLGVDLPDQDDFTLTPHQGTALGEIETAIASQGYKTFLLHGVTGSGKTEIYIRAMTATLRLGKSAIMLVPEIALTPVFSRRLRARFGDQVAIFHSSLRTGERFDEWNRLKRGEARIVIGTRSAVYAPVSNLGLVIVDEEHETSYRQHESPYYHGRDTAIVRAQKESAVVVLGSATPSLESYHNARNGKYRYLELPDRIANRAMAKAEIIDMREVFKTNRRAEVFSTQLLDAIEETHSRGAQSIILLNRRGFSSFLLCRSCGESIHCPNCDVTLTFHRSDQVLVCHYCNYRRQVPKQCPTCSGKYIHYVGEGTEQIELMLRQQFPSLRIARLDRDTTANKSTFENAIMQFAAGELDMLVGTQMLAKGHDFPNVTLVGVVSVDAGLSLPDFRSAERTFQLITQVAGRAGRGQRTGRVLVQTYYPHHYALRHACAQDYDGFYAEEIRYRRNLNYPPFVALASLLVHGVDLKKVVITADKVRKALDAANKDRVCRVLGPAPAPLARLKGEHRRQILIKCQSRPQLRLLIDNALATAGAHGCDVQSVNLEIDPVDLM